MLFIPKPLNDKFCEELFAAILIVWIDHKFKTVQQCIFTCQSGKSESKI